MIRLVALIISIVLQIIAASIALGFMKMTKYRVSWILLSISFVFMAVRKIIQLFEYFRGTPSYTWQMIDEWIGVLVSFMIIVGVILIREIFYSLKRAEIDRLRTERRVLNAIINTEENERRRFAKDLHDGLGPLLSTVKMSISTLSDKIKDPSGIDILNNTNHLVIESLNTIKEVSNNLSRHVLQYYDNGRGFDPSSLNKEDNKGMGLSNIETRVKSVEGVFILESSPGKGTTALIKVIDENS